MSASGGGRNRLAGESSPYLLLHRNNPVDWYPWGEEALAAARRDDKPIFLSVGYSTCYWCHVMERESFTDPAIAERMNRDFVNIKVDREERPELDEIYMVATQILTHQGGWPNSVFLTPELKPFFAGTYFPPRDGHGRPGFDTVLRSLADAWRERRADVQEQAESVARAIRHYLEERGAPSAELPGGDLAASALADLEASFDSAWGGFGSAPKFPTPSNLLLLLELAEGSPRAAEMLALTLERMGAGGLFDQLAGGFHRYSTDREWRVPHFEKMLYDNGLLLELYAREWRRAGNPEMATTARRTAGFLEREMTSPEGALWSAIDAETGGREGAYYVWTREELESVLGGEDFAFLAPLLGFDGAPFFEGGSYVLHRPRPLAELAARRRLDPAELEAQIEPLRARLLRARDARPRPPTDDKVLADWNGMAISGLAVAGRLLGEPRLVRRAAAAAGFVLEHLRPDGATLFHVWRQGRAAVPAFLADYAFLIRGLLALHRAEPAGRWLEAAVELAAELEERLADPAGGYFVAAEGPDILFRSKEVFDGAVPGANAVAALDLLELAEATGDERWRERAAATLRAFAGLAERHPAAVRTLVVAIRRLRLAGGERPVAPLAAEARAVVRPTLELGPADASGRRTFRLRLAIAPGWHLYGPGAPAEAGIVATVEGDGVALRRVRWPKPARQGPERVPVYRGEVEVEGQIESRAEGRSGEAAPDDGGAIRLRFQPCDEGRCLPPAEIRLPLEAPAD